MMSGSVSPTELGKARASGSKVGLSVVIGLATGAVMYYLVAVASTVRVPENFIFSPLALALTALVGAGAVVIAWRWPIVGLSAGILIILVVIAMAAMRVRWSSAPSDWLDPLNTIPYGAVTAYPVIVGAVMVMVAVLQLLPKRS